MKPGDPLPLWRQALSRWSQERLEEWAERAAILEYEARLPREDAEHQAFTIVWAAHYESTPLT